MRRVFILILSLAFTTFASWPGGGVKVVQTPESISNPQMVYINDGSVVISWEEWGPQIHIYCQKLDTTGVIHWDAEGISVCLSDSNQLDHHMVTDGQDAYFVWQDERSDDGDIYAQKLSGSTGQRLWGNEGRVVSLQSGEQGLPLADMLVNNQLGIIWQDYGPTEPGLDYDARTQWMNLNGQPSWGANGISVPRDLTRRGRQGCFRSGNNILALFSGRRESDTTAMFAQRIDSEGNFLWDTLGVLIEYATGFYGVTTDNAGGAIVLFKKGPGPVYVQRVDSLGQIRWQLGGVIVGEQALDLKTNLQHMYLLDEYTGVSSDTAGGCIVWYGVGGNTLRVQHVDSSGNLLWNSSGVIYWKEEIADDPLQPTKLSSDGNEGVLAVFDNMGWESPDWPPPVEQGVRVQRINADGEIVFDTNGVMVRLWEPEELPEEFLSAASAVPGGIILTWLDNRYNPNNSLHAQLVDTTGKIGSGIEEEVTSSFKPTLDVITTLSSNLISLRYSMSRGENGIIKLFDVSGSLTRSQKVTRAEGVITWDAASIPSGVYFAQLATTNNARVSRKLLILR
ncbi:hypothetical protein ES703_07081 [subsurface metagenome]